MTSTACCSGSTHPGTPKGHSGTLYGLPTYVAEPPNGADSKGVVVMVPDAFGWEFVNLRLLCDTLADRIGARLLLPEFMNGNSANVSALLNMKRVTDSNASWLTRIMSGLKAFSVLFPFMILNRLSVTQPRVTSYFSNLRESTDLPVGVIGYCWGGRHAVRLTHPTALTPSGKPLVDAAYTAHPSALSIPSDISQVSLPLAVCAGSADFVLPMSDVQKIQQIFGEKEEGTFDGQQGRKYEIKVVEAAMHGFAVRGDPDDEKELGYAQVAEDFAVEWFGRWMKGSA